MRRVLSAIAALILCAIFAIPALASALEPARPIIDLSAYEGISGFEHDQSTGEWKLRSNETEALLRAVRNGDLRSSGTGMAVLYLQLEGNSKTGMVAPVLYVDYAGRNMNATAISIRIGDVRYDLPVQVERVDVGGGIEQMRALLDPAGMEMLSRIARAEQVTLRLHGDNSYTTVLRVRKSYNSAKERLESFSLSCVNLSDELRAMQFDQYNMHAENAEDWYGKTGVRPLLQISNLKDEVVPTGTEVPALDKEMRMISSEETSRNAKLLEDKLIAMRYLAGVANNTYGTDTKRAVEDIQRMYGLVATGSADAQLLNILFGKASTAKGAPESIADILKPMEAADSVSAEAYIPYVIPDVLELTLNRYWFASMVQTTKPVSTLSSYSAANRDNLLLIVDGVAKNLSAGELSFSRSIQAKVVLDGKYAYDVTVKCESDAGERFDTYLLPLGESRVVFCAEVPASAVGAEGQWRLIVEAGGVQLSYDVR